MQIVSIGFVWLYSTAKRIRFEHDHPGGLGTNLANYYWDSQWQYWVFATCISLSLLILYKKQREASAIILIPIGRIILIVWVGLCIIGMELNYIPVISLGSGATY